MNAPTLLWHDYETFGANPSRDRPAQFAALRTDLDLQPVGEPISAYCWPARDTWPHPDACLLTGITPQHCQTHGVREAEFAALVHEALAEPGTCGVGYNSIRFDDEVTRFLLYRNFHEPYAREWERGNSRWDLIDLVRLCHALRPEGVVWPRRDDGTPSFKLEELSAANHLIHDTAHDALSDVHATIALARLIRAAQPRLYEFYFNLRFKREAQKLLDWTTMQPVLHVSSRFSASRGCLAMVAPLAAHPVQANAVIVYDLDADPEEFLRLDAEAIRHRVFTSREALGEDVARIPLKLVHTNRSPALAPLSALKGVDLTRIALDPERCQRHWQRLHESPEVAAKAREVFAPAEERATPDADQALYAGFIADADRARLNQVRRATPAELAAHPPRFDDERYRELLFRYRARNWPETLTSEEAQRWRDLRRARLLEAGAQASLDWTSYTACIAQCRAERDSPRDRALLDALDDWGRQLTEDLHA